MPKTYYKHLLEIACFSVESCIIAQNAGADRIEFCADYSLGGITPSHEDILSVRKLISIPIHIIIRPRAGNFIYTQIEINTMKTDILFCKENNIDGVVFGLLDSENNIDLKSNEELVKLSKPMSTTFHRAVDECANLEEAFVNLINLRFERVLTSGGKNSAIEGINDLNFLNNKFGKNLIIMPGGGIRNHNIKNIMNQTQCKEYHSAAITTTVNVVDYKEVQLLKETINQI